MRTLRTFLMGFVFGSLIQLAFFQDKFTFWQFVVSTTILITLQTIHRAGYTE